MDRNNSNDRTTAGVIAATVLIASIALLALAGLTGGVGAAEGENAGVSDGEVTGALVSAASVTNNISYQGRLTDDAGEPLGGMWYITFRLYNVSTGGTALDMDAHVVEVADGLFNTHICFDQSYFDGSELWLGVQVEADSEMTPRQELRPVPYALSLRPGAVIASSGPTALTVYSEPSYGIQGRSLHNIGLLGISGSSYSPPAGMHGVHGIGEGFGVYGEGGHTGVYGNGIDDGVKGESIDGNAVHGLSANGIGVAGHSDNNYGMYGTGGKYGGFFTTNHGGGWYDPNAGVNATTTHDYSDGVHAYTTGYISYGVYASTTGEGSHGVVASTAGDYSVGVVAYTIGYYSHGVTASTTGNDSCGVVASTDGDYSDGVQAVTTGNDSEGVFVITCGTNSQGFWASTTGNDSEGVYASTTGNDSEGVVALASGYDSEGVYAYSDKDCGVYGEGGEYGGFFTTNQGGLWDDHNAGVNATTAHDYSDGVYAYTTGDNSHGVCASTIGGGSDGVYASTIGDGSHGVCAYTKGDNSEGVVALASGYDSEGVVAHSNQYHGIYASTGRADQKYGVYTPDYMWAHGIQFPSTDVAEYFPTPEDPEPGTVMTIDPAGGSKLRSSTNAYDTTVAGIVSTEPGVSLGTKEDGNDGEKLIAVAGRVPCKVDASYAAIKPGDLLTTSDTQGHAMKAQPVEIGGIEIYRPGTTIGKALEPLDAGTGTIEVLVTLQ